MKLFIRITIITVISTLVVLTFVSRTIYNRGLPQVSAAKVEMSFVPLEHKVTGIIAYQEETAVLRFMLPSEVDISGRGVSMEATVNVRHVMYGLVWFEDVTASFRITESRPVGANTLYAAAFVGLDGAPVAGQNVSVLVEERGEIQTHVVPSNGVFDIGNDEFVVYALDSRPGIMGPEDFVTAYKVAVQRDNGELASVMLAEEGEELSEMILAHDVSGWLANGDTVWVRERDVY
jgi:hypothetical protein